jgi:3'-phosphoadenosine 5'-phosphosulfate sulfotransferase (PAPS reductase)/FAD synthetase
VKTALQFSGGRDSLALLVHLRAEWKNFTVYFCDPGDTPEETLDLAALVEKKVPNFVRVPGRVLQMHAVAWPTDLVPADSTKFGKAMGGDEIPLIDRYNCCAQSIMRPLHEKMLEDGVELVLRGQRLSERIKSPMLSGTKSEYEVQYPINGWSDMQVHDAIAFSEFPLPRFYRHGLSGAVDCKTCTAWWDHGGQGYIRKHYPEAYAEVDRRMVFIRSAITKQLNHLAKV